MTTYSIRFRVPDGRDLGPCVFSEGSSILELKQWCVQGLREGGEGEGEAASGEAGKGSISVRNIVLITAGRIPEDAKKLGDLNLTSTDIRGNVYLTTFHCVVREQEINSKVNNTGATNKDTVGCCVLM